MWCRPAIAVVLVLALVGPGYADDRPTMRELERAFDEASSLDDQRAVVERLEGWRQADRLRALARWAKDSAYEPETVAMLARAMLDLGSPGAASRRLRSLLKDDNYAHARTGVLRVLIDAPKGKSLRVRDVGGKPIYDLAAFLLASRLTKQPEELAGNPGARALANLAALVAWLRDPPDEEPWPLAGKLLRNVPPLNKTLSRALTRRVLAALPAPTPTDLQGWPQRWLVHLWSEGEVQAFALMFTRMRLAQSEVVLGEIARKRDPAMVAPLVEALARVRPHSAIFYRIQGVLQDLTGSQAPPDPEQWRSWIAGHRRWLAKFKVLPQTHNTEAAVSHGIAFLLSRQREDGSFRYGFGRHDGRQSVGTTALVLYALVKAGVPSKVAALQRAARYLVQQMRGGGRSPLFRSNYATSIAVMALRALDAKAWRKPLETMVARLTGGQMANGGWSYGLPYGTNARRDRGIDLSNTQYSVLGLRAAAFARIPIDPALWESLLDLMRKSEDGRSGDWNYLHPGRRNVRPGMSAIAAASMLIARSQLEKELTLDQVLADEQVVRALRSMARKYGDNRTPRRTYERLDLYTLYSIERVGALFGIYSFNGVPWYAAGADVLLDTQLRDGGWGKKDESIKWWTTWGRNVDTAYALLFLRRATTAVFSANLDVPANPNEPIRRVQRTQKPPPTAKAGDGSAPGASPAAPRRTPVAATERIRAWCANALRNNLERAESMVDRAMLWRAVAAVDPIDAEAHVLAGFGLGANGGWRLDPLLDAARPRGRPSDWARGRVAAILDDGARQAIRASKTQGLAVQARRDLAQLAIALKRAARRPYPE